MQIIKHFWKIEGKLSFFLFVKSLYCLGDVLLSRWLGSLEKSVKAYYIKSKEESSILKGVFLKKNCHFNSEDLKDVVMCTISHCGKKTSTTMKKWGQFSISFINFLSQMQSFVLRKIAFLQNFKIKCPSVVLVCLWMFFRNTCLSWGSFLKTHVGGRSVFVMAVVHVLDLFLPQNPELIGNHKLLIG